MTRTANLRANLGRHGGAGCTNHVLAIGAGSDYRCGLSPATKDTAPKPPNITKVFGPEYRRVRQTAAKPTSVQMDRCMYVPMCVCMNVWKFITLPLSDRICRGDNTPPNLSAALARWIQASKMIRQDGPGLSSGRRLA